MKIYATTLSANGRKVLAVSRQLGLNPEIHDVNVYRGEGRTAQYLAINPSGKIPTLIDGEFVLSAARRDATPVRRQPEPMTSPWP